MDILVVFGRDVEIFELRLGDSFADVASPFSLPLTPAPTPSPATTPQSSPSPTTTLTPVSTPVQTTVLPTPNPGEPCVAFASCEQCVNVALHPLRPNCRFCGTACQEGGACNQTPNINAGGACPTLAPTPEVLSLPVVSSTLQATELLTASTSLNVSTTSAAVGESVQPPTGSQLEWIIPIALIGAVCLVGSFVTGVVISRRCRTLSTEAPAPAHDVQNQDSQYGSLPLSGRAEQTTYDVGKFSAEYSSARV
jgi:hypothetical protein